MIYYLCKLTIRITSFVVTAKLIIQISIKLILDDLIANNGISGIPSHYHFMYFSLCDSSTYTTFEKCDRVLCDRVLKRSFHLLQTLHIITRPYLYLGHYYYIKFKITHMYVNARIFINMYIHTRKYNTHTHIHARTHARTHAHATNNT